MLTRLSLLTHIFLTTAPSSQESSSAPPSMLVTWATLNKLLNSPLTPTVSNSTRKPSMRNSETPNYPSNLMLKMERKVKILLTVKSNTSHGTLKTPSQKSWPRELPLSLDLKLNKTSSLLWEAQTQRELKTFSLWSTLVYLPMLMNNSVLRKVSKTSLSQTTQTAWKNSSEIERRLLKHNASRFS